MTGSMGRTGVSGSIGASTVTSLFAARAAYAGDARALVDDRVSWTYAQLRDRVSRLAGHLRSRGIAPGDRIAVLSRNCSEHLEVFLACGWIGAILRGIALISRCAGLVGHIAEEQQAPAMRALWEAADAAVPYEEALSTLEEKPR